MKERDYRFDFLRAVAIVTIIMGHILTTFADDPGEIVVKEYINTILRFGVAMFIFLSGYFFRSDTSFEYLLQKIKRVLLPYTFISFVSVSYLIIRNNWDASNIPEILASYFLGHGFGFYFIPLIVIIYSIWFMLIRLNLTKRINLILIVGIILQIFWLTIDETLYSRFNLYDTNFLQFQLNEFIFYRNPFTWFAFFALGAWYRIESSAALIKRFRVLIYLLLVGSFLIYNFMIANTLGDYTPYGSVIWSIFSVSIIFTILNVNLNKFFKHKIVTYLALHSYAFFLLHYFFIYLLIDIDQKTEISFSYASTIILFPMIMILCAVIIKIVTRILGPKAKFVIGTTS